MAEELTKALENFDLCENERYGAELNDEDLKVSVAECKMSTLGRIVGEKSISFSGIKGFTNQIWSFPRNLKIAELDPNLFQFIFSKAEDKERILRGKSWLIDNQLLLVKNWSEDVENSKLTFNNTQIWVQI
ncbi:hypothetical protein ACH5RR_013798 [Cinchona calisaya]|uniref:DUF4283 domain-containing protein n=1 Tax=Cinchona calisaya TaxID=153742 RepID=A0ABD3A120_9GENT